MKLKDSPAALFHHYILDAKRRRREAKYALAMLFFTLLFFLWVWLVYQQPPTGRIGSIPTIVFTIIISQTLYYLLFTCYLGSKVVDIQKDREEEML